MSRSEGAHSSVQVEGAQWRVPHTTHSTHTHSTQHTTHSTQHTANIHTHTHTHTRTHTHTHNTQHTTHNTQHTTHNTHTPPLFLHSLSCIEAVILAALILSFTLCSTQSLVYLIKSSSISFISSILSCSAYICSIPCHDSREQYELV